MDLITLADLPELTGSDPAPRSTIVVARLDDKLYDPRYGRFAIAQADVDGWKQNLASTFGGRVSIDFDHSSDRGKGTKAAAWITGLGQSGNDVTADVEWTPSGAQSVRDGDYKYISPTFVSNFVDEHKESHGRALIGAALTNRPVLRKGMPTLSLSLDDFDEVAVPGSQVLTPKQQRKRARKQAAKALARDSRAQMPDLKALARLLELDENADQLTILAAVAALDPNAKPKSDLGQEVALSYDDSTAGRRKAEKKAAKKARKLAEAREDGTMALSADGYADLLTKANAGQAAALQLSEQTFDMAWNKALSEGRAAPSQEDTMRALHREKPDLAIKTLDSFVQIVPTRPTGSGDGPHDTGPAPMGMDEGRYSLHTQAQARAKQLAAQTPGLSEDDAYSMAVLELDDAQHPDEGGF